MFNWQDSLVILLTVMATTLSSFRLPTKADDYYLVRFAVSLHIATGVGIVVTAFQNYYDSMKDPVAWILSCFGEEMPVIVYLFALAFGFLGLGHTVLVAVLKQVQSGLALRTIAAVSVFVQISLYTHALYVKTGSPPS